MSNEELLRPVTAVIVTYQSAQTIGGTLAAARRCYRAGLLNVVVVDNYSTDGTREILGREDSWLRLMLTNRNNGFGRACNIGFAQVASPYTIFINPDATIEPEAIETMLQFMNRHPRVGIVGPATICGTDESGLLQHTGQRPTPWTILRSCIPILKRRSHDWIIAIGSAPRRTGWICGAVLMIRTNLMRQLGGFDPRFFLYWEETDLCKRAEDVGYEIWALGTAVAHHIVGASSTADHMRYAGFSIARHYYQSRFYYMTKHHGKVSASLAELCEFIRLSLKSVVDLVRGRGPDEFRARLQAPLFSMPEQVSNDRKV